MALFHPKLGYYRQPKRPRIGYVRGDRFLHRHHLRPALWRTGGRRLCPTCSAAAIPAASPTSKSEPSPAPPSAWASGIRSARSAPSASAQRSTWPNLASFFPTSFLTPSPFTASSSAAEPGANSGSPGESGNRLAEVECPGRRIFLRAKRRRNIRCVAALASSERRPAGSAPLPPRRPEEGYHLDLPLAAARLLETLDRRAALVGSLRRLRLRQELDRTGRGDARRHRASLPPASSIGGTARPARRAGPHLPHLLGLALPRALEARGGFFLEPDDRIPGGFFRAPRRRLDRCDGRRRSRPLQPEPRSLALMQLLHPAHLGQKFQVIHAGRG